MLVTVVENYEELSREGARRVADLVRKKPDCVLGFATGSTPLGMYAELIRMHKEGGLDFSKVVTFNLDAHSRNIPHRIHPEESIEECTGPVPRRQAGCPVGVATQHRGNKWTSVVGLRGLLVDDYSAF
jgi:hypothetical protein